MTRNEIRNTLKKIGVFPSKKLGQSFLANDSYNHAILDSINFESDDVLLEIGSGIGNLTRLLLESKKAVIAVEIDGRLSSYLRKEFSSFEKFHLYCDDILKIDLAMLKETHYPNIKKLRVIGNIPYSLSSPIIKRMITFRDYIEDVHLLIQKEVWERLSGEPGTKDYGFFTLLVKLYFSTSRILDISHENFYPVPKVDSTLIRLEPLKIDGLKNPDSLLKMLSKVFSQRRKMLKNTLLLIPGIEIEATGLANIFKDLEISPMARPEELSLKQFISLADKIFQNNVL
jgi:16S rRNA (adenine1518-N6/adenine1519-N6)-dimethyltransferase